MLNESASISRRQLLSTTAAVAICSGMQAIAQSPKPTAAPAKNRLLVRSPDATQLQTRSKSVLELEGKLLVNEPDLTNKQKSRAADVKAQSTLDYFELIAWDKQRNCVGAVREYVEAGAEHWVAGNTSKTKLRDKCVNTLVLKKDDQWQQLCLTEPMLVNEVELILTPLNTNMLELLLPEQPAKASEPWQVTAEAAREIFNLEAVHQCDLVAKINKVESGVASIDLNGSVDGTANSVATQLTISGNFQAKLASVCAMVSWVGLVIREKRSISQAEPGFDITARIRLIREEQVREPFINAIELTKLSSKSNELPWFIKTGSALGHYTFLASRNWKTYIDTGEEAIFRLVSNNSIVAQCNVTRLPNLDAGKQLTLAALQQEIRQSLGDKFGNFIEASEKVTPNKLKMMRVVASGQSQEVPIQWIYAHMSNDLGQRVSLVFTMGANMVEQFAASDEQICGTFALIPVAEPTESEKPEVAPKLSSVPVTEQKK